MDEFPSDGDELFCDDEGVEMTLTDNGDVPPCPYPAFPPAPGTWGT